MLVKYLRALLSCFVKKQDTDFLSHQSYPDANKQVLLYSGTERDVFKEFVLSSDGYVSLDTESEGEKMDPYIQASTILSYISTNGRSCIFVPVKKGENITVVLRGSLKKEIKFFGSIGSK